MMDLAEWLREFRALHEKAHRGALTPDESAAYLAGRDELAGALISAQRLLVDATEPPRKALRVALALQVDLESSTSWVRAVTSTVSVGGFSASRRRLRRARGSTASSAFPAASGSRRLSSRAR